MNKELEPYYLYKEHLSENQPHTVCYQGTNYTFQFHGPTLGLTGNWLEVIREDGVVRKFGSGHSSELIWRAFHHVDKGWEGKQIPAYREGEADSDCAEANDYV
jgi:hypothetical protein